MKSTQTRREIDMLHGKIWDKLLLLSLPLAATAILQQLFNAADVAVLGSFVEGKDLAKAAMAAVGSNSAVVSLLVNFFVGISLGTNVIIAQCIGMGHHKSIHRTVHTSIVLAVCGGLLIAICGQLFVTPLLSAMGVPDDVFDMASLYLRIYLAGMPAILLYNFEAAIFRSSGDTRTPLAVLTASGVMNVVLNLFFVLVMKRTVDGVAIATVASNAMSAAVLFVLLCRSKGDVHIDIRSLRVDSNNLLRILRIGLPAGVQGMVFSLANICVQSAINSLDTTMMAASSAAYNLEVFTYCIINSFGQACTTIVGQNCGAGKLDRCHKALWVTITFSSVLFGLTACLILTFGNSLLSMFNGDPEVIRFGMVRLRYIFFAHIFSLFVEVLSGYLRGFGMSVIPALCSLVFICGTRILWVYFIFPKFPTFAGLMTVYPVSLGITAAIIAVCCLVMRKRIESHAGNMPA